MGVGETWVGVVEGEIRLEREFRVDRGKLFFFLMADFACPFQIRDPDFAL